MRLLKIHKLSTDTETKKWPKHPFFSCNIYFVFFLYKDYFGEQALLTNDKRSAHIRASGPLEVLVLNRSQFQKLKNSSDIIFAKRRAVCADKVVPGIKVRFFLN